MGDLMLTDERRTLADACRAFAEREILPHAQQWERDGQVPRELHLAAGKAGFLGVGYPEAMGGQGGGVLDSLCVSEAMIRAGAPLGTLASLFSHSVALPHMIAAGTPEQIERFVRPTLAGELIGSLGVTEAEAGSDLTNTATRAVRDGDYFVVTGAKMYITSGTRADFVTTAVRTRGEGAKGISMLVIESSTPGFIVERRLDKMGWRSSDTAELTFDHCRVPVDNLVGGEGEGFGLLMNQLISERLGMAVQAYATAQRCLDLALNYARERHTFGVPLIKRQVVRHNLVRMREDVDLARTYTLSLAERFEAGELIHAESCLAKIAAARLSQAVVERATQLHGSLGFMTGTEVERHYRDIRVSSVGGGASEVLTDWAAKLLGYT
jgi:acyl-CoA dehydrogenase